MDKYEKICEILTDRREDTKAVLAVFASTSYSVCANGDWGADGMDMYVMRKIDDKDDCTD